MEKEKDYCQPEPYVVVERWGERRSQVELASQKCKWQAQPWLALHNAEKVSHVITFDDDQPSMFEYKCRHIGIPGTFLIFIGVKTIINRCQSIVKKFSTKSKLCEKRKLPTIAEYRIIE